MFQPYHINYFSMQIVVIINWGIKELHIKIRLSYTFRLESSNFLRCFKLWNLHIIFRRILLIVTLSRLHAQQKWQTFKLCELVIILYFILKNYWYEKKIGFLFTDFSFYFHSISSVTYHAWYINIFITVHIIYLF